jgi:quercetin dioxygenase-like cupin family protein
MHLHQNVRPSPSEHGKKTMRTLNSSAGSHWPGIHWATPFVFLAAIFSASPATLAQEEQFDLVRTVHIFEEPRHRTVHSERNLRLLDVQINPGDTTLPHTHDFAILYTYISNGAGPLNGRVSSITDYVKEPLTHRVSNEGPGLFRILALGNTGAALPDNADDLPSGLPGEPTLENPWFRSYRLELAPGASTASFSHRNPSVVVQVSEGQAHVSRSDGITTELKAMGDWAWRDPGQSYQVRNMGSTTLTFVINEARRAESTQ